MKAKSLFKTKTFKLGVIGFLSGITPIIIRCAYEHRFLSVNEAIETAALSSTFATILVGRAANDPVYTPNGLPGANKDDFNGTDNRS